MSQAINLFSASQRSSDREDNSLDLAIALSPSRNSDPFSQIPPGFSLSPGPEPFPTIAPVYLSSSFPSSYPNPFPLFYPLPPAGPALPLATKRRAHRSSQAQKDDSGKGLSPAERKAAHAEKNRQFARESRERKRLYVERLEKEVASLRGELAWYKEHFARYELIDRKRDLDETERVETIRAALGEMARTGTSSSQLSTLVIKKYGEHFEERKKALEQLFRIILEVAVPNSLRYQMWKSENGIDMLKPENLSKYFGYQLGSVAMQRALEHIRIAHGKASEIQAKLTKLSDSIRKNVRRMLESQRNIQMDAARIGNSLRDCIPPTYTAEHAMVDMKYFPKLAGWKELSDASIFRVTEQDFWCDTTSAAELDEDEIEEKEGEDNRKQARGGTASCEEAAHI